jgi:hypothetical protein
MSESEHESDHEEAVFSVIEWFQSTKISVVGQRKLRDNQVNDKESLLLMSDHDISSIKLAAADRAKLESGISKLRGL